MTEKKSATITSEEAVQRGALNAGLSARAYEIYQGQGGEPGVFAVTNKLQ